MEQFLRLSAGLTEIDYNKPMENLSNVNWLLIFGGLGFVILELLVGIETGFDLVLVGKTLIIGGGVGNFFDNWVIGVATTGVLALSYVFLGRKYLKDKLYTKPHLSNAAALIGKKGVVTKLISPNQPGLVKVDNELWRAASGEEIAEGVEVEVQKIEGVTVTVVKL